jgi:hypothetical protein
MGEYGRGLGDLGSVKYKDGPVRSAAVGRALARDVAGECLDGR